MFATSCCRTPGGATSGSKERSSGLGVRVSANIATVLRAHHLGPAPRRGPTWREFLIQQASGIIACDFLTVETSGFGRCMCCSSWSSGERGCTWPKRPGIRIRRVTQLARSVAWTLEEQRTFPRFLIHDRDTKFSGSFDAVFKADGTRIICTPIRERERLRPEVGGNRSRGVSGLDADPRTPPPGTGPTDLRPAFQRPPASPGPEPEGAGRSRPATPPSTTWPGATAIRCRRTHQ